VIELPLLNDGGKGIRNASRVLLFGDERDGSLLERRMSGDEGGALRTTGVNATFFNGIEEVLRFVVVRLSWFMLLRLSVELSLAN
jgi:hypothetical protein